MTDSQVLFPVLAGRLEAKGLEVRVAAPRSGNAVLVVASPGARERGEVRIGGDGSVVYAYGEATDDAGITRLVSDVTGYLSRRRAPSRPGSRPALHARVSADIRRAIADGTYDRVLPPHGDLADEHGVSLITLRKALETLEAEGLIVVRQGRGTFIN